MPPPPVSKKAENLKAEAKKLEDLAKKKVQTIDKTEKTEHDNVKKEIQLIKAELDTVKTKTEAVKSGEAEETGWDEKAVQIGDRMKQLIENEARLQHSLLLKTDEATVELELKAKPIRKELPLVSDFSEEDRVQMLAGIDRSINKLKDRRSMIEAAEAKLNRQMQVLMECTPDPTEDRDTIMSKLQMSFDVVSGANDPDRARDDLLKQLAPSSRNLGRALTGTPSTSQKKPTDKPNTPDKKHGQGSPPASQNMGRAPRISNPHALSPTATTNMGNPSAPQSTTPKPPNVVKPK